MGNKNYVARKYLGVGYLFVIMSKVINVLLRADFGTPTNIKCEGAIRKIKHIDR